MKRLKDILKNDGVKALVFPFLIVTIFYFGIYLIDINYIKDYHAISYVYGSYSLIVVVLIIIKMKT